MCWTCGSCDFECPVNIATGRLRPQKIVRLASLGLLDELIHLPEIWYCLQCRRCMQICPNSVKPEPLIGWLRQQALATGQVDRPSYLRIRMLFSVFQRIRWHAAALCREGELQDVTDGQWRRWMKTPVVDSLGGAEPISFPADHNPAGKIPFLHRLSLCFTCGECSSACPVAVSREVFDPRSLFRMLALGMTDALLASPSIWLCIACGRCTDACTQTVRGREAIADLRARAVEEGVVDPSYFYRLQRADRLLYERLLNEIDACL
jgi:heterodisulfide reductase subunit C